MYTPFKDTSPRQQTLTSFTLFFTLIAVAELVSNFFVETLPVFHYVAKPLVMVSLIGYFFWQTRHYRDVYLIIMQGGMVFSLLGDVFLMFPGPQFFILGLGSFMLTHVCYIVVFTKTDNPRLEKPLLKRKPWLTSLFAAFGAIILWMIHGTLGDMLWPVAIYMAVILTMAMMALNRWKRVSDISFGYVFLGALLFVLSDSIIAIDRFAGDLIPIPLAGTWIMLTYIAAQYLIVAGILHFVWRPKPQAVGMN